MKMNKGLDPNLWKSSLNNEMMLKYVEKGSVILEIGPGAGRWSEFLQKLASRLILADISPTCLEICRNRFESCDNVSYNLIERGLNFIANDCIDFIWSYDVFVHINPTEVEHYIADCARILRPGGYAVIHHAGEYVSRKHARIESSRAYMSSSLFKTIVCKYKLEMVEQNSPLPHFPGDMLSVFRKPMQK